MGSVFSADVGLSPEELSHLQAETGFDVVILSPMDQSLFLLVTCTGFKYMIEKGYM